MLQLARGSGTPAAATTQTRPRAAAPHPRPRSAEPGADTRRLAVGLCAPSSLESRDINILLFTTQIKHRLLTPSRDHALELKVTFCVRGVMSPLLANIYLDPLDQHMAAVGVEMVRYADDFVLLCRSQADAEQALTVVATWTHAAGLTLHPEKTRVVDATQPGGFDFLGYHFE